MGEHDRKEGGENIMNQIMQGDILEVLKTMEAESVNCIITSPPYWGLRDYGVEGQIGLEPTLDAYLSRLMAVTAELKRVLRNDGVMFWNHGDCYGGSGGAGGDYNEGGLKDGQPKYPRRSRFIGDEHPVTPAGQKAMSIPLAPKCMAFQNYRLIIKMIDEQGWILRNTIIWHKPNHMPSSVRDRFSNSYEPVFMLTKSKRYWFDLDAVREPHKEASFKRSKRACSGKWLDDSRSSFPDKNPHNIKKKRPNVVTVNEMDILKYDNVSLNKAGKNPGDVWKIPTQPFPEAHFATFPERLVEPMIKAGCPEGGVVLDPFAGSGTTLIVARKLLRNYQGIELNPKYVEMANKRLNKIPARLDRYV